MSFLDEPDEPVRQTRRRPPARPYTDRQTLMVRRTVAGGAALVLLILLVLGVRGCLDARGDRAIKDYAGGSAALLEESKQQSDALFDLLNGRTRVDNDVTVVNALNGLRVQSAQLVDRAGDLDVPGAMEGPHGYLVELLTFRRDGLRQIADQLPSALGDQERREGTEGVAGAMTAFLTSDVIYRQRFRTGLMAELEREELADELAVPDSRFLRDFVWLDPSFVADKVSAIRAGGAGEAAAAPGLHGNGLIGTSLGGVALVPGGPATVTLSDDLAFEVQVANQGEHIETDVGVAVTVGSGDDAIELEEPLDEIAPGEQQTVTLPLGEQPPTGQSVPVEVEVLPVPGEEKTDNNVASYSVVFTR